MAFIGIKHLVLLQPTIIRSEQFCKSKDSQACVRRFPLLVGSGHETSVIGTSLAPMWGLFFMYRSLGYVMFTSVMTFFTVYYYTVMLVGALKAV